MRIIYRFILGLGLSLAVMILSANADPLLSFDVITSYDSFGHATSVAVPIRIAGLGNESLAAYDIDFLFVNTVLRLRSVQFGPFLGDPDKEFIFFEPSQPPFGTGLEAITGASLLPTINPVISDINLFEISLLASLTGQPTQFLLVGLNFDVIQRESFSSVLLQANALGNEFGDALLNPAPVVGSISTANVPEPGTLFLVGGGLVMTILAGRRLQIRKQKY